MEALVLILGEIIFALLAPLVVAVIDLIGAAIAAVFSFVPLLRREKPVNGSTATEANQSVRSGTAKNVLIALLGIAAMLFSALLILNRFYFEESVRMVFGALERRAGIETECSAISGSVFSGRISLGDCTVVRSGHSSSDFQLELDSVDFDLQLTSLFGTAEVQTAYVAGLRGHAQRHDSQGEADDVVDRPRRSFVVRDLKIERVNVNLSGFNKDGGEFELPVQVVMASSSPLRSRLALFDILFRSNATGTVAGAEFEIRTGGDSSGRQTVWRASDVPVASLGAIAGGVLSWFRGGVVDIYVEDNWRRGDQLEIDMDWRLGFRDVEVQAPGSAGVMTRLATGPIVDYVNGHDGDFPFEFQMVINENQFVYKASLAAAGLWKAVGESVNKVLAGFGVEMPGSAAETGEQLKEGARSVLDRLRGPKDEEKDE